MVMFIYLERAAPHPGPRAPAGSPAPRAPVPVNIISDDDILCTISLRSVNYFNVIVLWHYTQKT